MLEAFEEEAKETGYPRLLSTAAVSADKGNIDAGNEIAEIRKWMHWVSRGPQILEQRFLSFLGGEHPTKSSCERCKRRFRNETSKLS